MYLYKVEGKLFLIFSYLVWHEMKLFCANFFLKITLSHAKLNKENKFILYKTK